MRRKKGITVTMLTVTLIVLAILGTTITVSIHSTINYSRLTTWANELENIQSVVNEELKLNSSVPTLSDIVLDVSEYSEDVINEQFEGETLTAESTISLRVLDLGKLKITDTIYGILETSDDVYAMSTTTGRVYYVKGLKSSGKTYFSLTDELKTMYELDSVNVNIDTIVYKPNIVGYTNQPIIITAYIPEGYTNIQITTTNNDIQIGEALLNNGKYEYVINTNNVTGNYTITTTYTKDGINETSTYEVSTFDNTKPAISMLFVDEEDNVYMTNLKGSDENGIKYFKFASTEISEDNAKEYFSTNGNNIINGKIYLENKIYTIYAEDNAGNFKIFTFDATNYASQEWVVSIVDGVPIPKGFVASPYGSDKANGIAENTKKGGLVIYELGENETEIPNTEDYHTSVTTRNQYVWIPVDKEKFDTTFVRKDWDNDNSVVDTEGNYYALGTTDKYWEVTSNVELTTANLQYMTKETLEEVQKMYASVKKYGGFYVARYEAGVDEKNIRCSIPAEIVKTLANVHLKMNKIPYNYMRASDSEIMNVETGGAIEVARSLYPETNTDYGVVSTLMYGVQWDRILSWFLETEAKDIHGNKINLTNSTTYGNYLDNEIEYKTFNEGAMYATDISVQSPTPKYDKVTAKKGLSTTWLLTTGATEETRVNNIYDLAGNLWERTMENISSTNRSARGGCLLINGSDYPVVYRGSSLTDYEVSWDDGFRPTLYIK